MSWNSMNDVPNPIIDANGDPYGGAVLKAYLPGTTTSTSIAIDSSGSSPQTTVTANAEGKWEVSGNEVIPHIDRKHKWAIFANATDAAANTPAYMGFFDNVEQVAAAGASSTIGKAYATLALAVAATDLEDGDVLEIKEYHFGIGGGNFKTDVVLLSTTTVNTYNIVAWGNNTGAATDLALKLRDDGGPSNWAHYGAYTDGTNATFTTGAITAAFEDRISTYAPAGPGATTTYLTNAVIKVGNGNARLVSGAHRITVTIENATSDVFDMGDTNDASTSIIEGLTIKSLAGGGHVFVPKFNLSLFTLQDCTVNQANLDKSIWYQVTGYSGGNVVQRCHLVAKAGTQTAHPWHHQSPEITNGFVFRDLRCDNSGGGLQFFNVNNETSSTFNTNGTFENITFELTNGGMIKLGGCRAVDVVNCGAYDLNAEQDGDGIWIGASNGGGNSEQIGLERVHKLATGGYSLGSGINDIKIVAGQATVISRCFNAQSGNRFTVDYGNQKVLHIQRPDEATAGTYTNAANVSIIDSSLGIKAFSDRTTVGTSSKEKTISSGAITVDMTYHTIDTEADAASDDLDTITGTYFDEGDILTLRAANSARTVVMKDGTGNMQLNGDFSLDSTKDTIQLLFADSAWQEVSRSSNA